MIGSSGAVLSISNGRHRRRGRRGLTAVTLALAVAVSGGIVGVLQAGHAAGSPESSVGPFSHFPQ
jgi:hypothetical protein